MSSVGASRLHLTTIESQSLHRLMNLFDDDWHDQYLSIEVLGPAMTAALYSDPLSVSWTRLYIFGALDVVCSLSSFSVHSSVTP